LLPCAEIVAGVPLEPHDIIHDHFTRFRKQLGDMDSNTKLILDELRSVQANLTARMDLMESSVGKRVGSLEDAAKAFDTWRPKVDATVDELRAEVGAIRKTDEKVETLREEMTALRKSVSRSVLDAAPAVPTGVLPAPPKVSVATIPASWTKFSPLGHREESSHRGFEYPTQSPVKGTLTPSNPDPKPKLLRSYSGSALIAGVPSGSGGDDGFPRRCWHGEGVPGGNWSREGIHEHIPKMNFSPI